MNSNESLCPQCGSALPARAPQGLCPKCLFAALAAPTEDGGPSAGLPLPSAAELAPHFPQLEIGECLGRGGMGVVYRARQKSLDRMVALKLLAPERVGDPLFAERFSREAQALAKLSHPNIVTIHDFGQAGGFFYLLMEYVDGVNLRQAMQAGRFRPEQALAVVPPVCEALQYAHEHGIVHRDIKPENLLLDREGRVKIADFGVVKLMSGEPDKSGGVEISSETEMTGAGLTGEKGAPGTPGYMAPEQRESRATDHRADIYSLGVVLYEMLTGERPGASLEPPSRRVQVDVRIDEIVLRALEVRPEMRFATAAEFRTQVEAASLPETLVAEERADETEEPEPEPVVAHLRPWEVRWQALAPWRRRLVAGVLLVLAAGLLLACVFIDRQLEVLPGGRQIDTWNFGAGRPWLVEVSTFQSTRQTEKSLHLLTPSFACGLGAMGLLVVLGLLVQAGRGAEWCWLSMVDRSGGGRRVRWGRMLLVTGAAFLAAGNAGVLGCAIMQAVTGFSPPLLVCVFVMPGFVVPPLVGLVARHSGGRAQIVEPVRDGEPRTIVAVLTTPEDLATARGQLGLMWRRGPLVLDERRIHHECRGVRTTIPLAAIEDVSFGFLPRGMNPARLQVICVTWRDGGKRSRVLIGPSPRIFGTPGEWNRWSAEWRGLIRAAAKRATGREPGTTPAEAQGLPASAPGMLRLGLGALCFAALAALVLFLSGRERGPYQLLALSPLLAPLVGLVLVRLFPKVPAVAVVVAVALGLLGVSLSLRRHSPRPPMAPAPVEVEKTPVERGGRVEVEKR